jgi:hypothetical protein
MSLRNVMRKAAGLLVEMPPDGGAGDSTPQGGISPDAADYSTRPAPDIDALLAAVRNPKDEKDEKGKLSSGMKPVTATATQVAQSGPGPNLEQIKHAAAGAAGSGEAKTEKTSIVGADGKIKLPVIYEAAGVPATNFTAEQALEVISALPADLPLEVRRQTVKATLAAIGKTLGATPQTIVGDATRKLAALEAYLESFSKKSEEFTKKVETDIATLEAQIQEKRKAIESAQRRVEELSRFCDQEAERLDDVLEFFSLDVGSSKYAAPGQNPAPSADSERKPSDKR